MELLNWFKELYIHEDSWDSTVARRIRSLVRTEAVKVNQRPYSEISGPLSASQFDHSKRRLYLSQHQGHFFRKCPGTQGAACCNYYVLNLGAQCNMNCSYCYLQSYINSPLTQIFTNIDRALDELDELTAKFPNAPFRVGTGEVIDSLSLDDLSLYSRILVEWFSKHPRLTLEFKTKSDNIKNFVTRPHGRNVVVSFSVNPEQIIAAEEHGTARLSERLAAARRASDHEFPVAFHMDPMLCVPNWQILYSELVDQITSMFTPDQIKWISVGSLRYPPEMKHILRERFGAETAALTGELFLSKDGKLRYDQRLRSQMFNHVISEFQERDKKFPVFLCMETPEAWLGTFEKTPRQIGAIKELFRPMPQA